MIRTSAAVLTVAVALAAGACSQQAEAPADVPAAVSVETPAQTPLPAVDTPALQAALSPDETFSVVEFPRAGSKVETGRVEGRKTTVWAVPVAAGQTLTVTFAPSNTNLYINVFDAADTSGAAVHRGEVDGATATLAAVKDTVFIIRPFQPRAMARRDEAGDYTLTVARS